MTKNAIVTLGTRGGDLKGQKRLTKSLSKVGFNGTIYTYNDFDDIDSPSHGINPYAFKLYAIAKARTNGHQNVMWCDSSFFAVGDVNGLFDIIERDGYLMEDAGHRVGSWSNDASLKYFELSRDEAMKYPMYSAGMTGVNFSNETAIEFFDQWFKSLQQGIFRGAWTNESNQCSKDTRCEGHRHDMTCASIIANRMNMKFQTCGKYLEYMPPSKTPKSKTIVFGLQGII